MVIFNPVLIPIIGSYLFGFPSSFLSLPLPSVLIFQVMMGKVEEVVGQTRKPGLQTK